MNKNIPSSQDLENYLRSTPFDKSLCHVVGPYIGDQPVLFFIVASASSQQGLDAEKEKTASKLIQQLVSDADVKDIFITEDCDLEVPQKTVLPCEANTLLEKSAINGLHHAQTMLSPNTLTVVGIDEPTNYRNALEVFKKWQADQDRMLKALAILHTSLMKLIVYTNKTIQALLVRREVYYCCRTTLGEYVRGLASQAKAAGLALQETPEFLNFYELVLRDQQLDSEKVKKEIEVFGDHLLQAFGNKELWLRKTIDALSSAQTGQTQELEAQIQFLTDYLSISFNLHKLKESLFFRTAMYGAYVEGFTELEKSLEQVSRKRREKAFLSGVLQGPMHILMLLTRKLMSTGTHRETVIPEVYDFILDAGIFAGFDETQIPTLIQQVQYGNHYRSLVTTQLMKAIEKIENRLLEQAIASENDRDVVALFRTHTVLSRRVQLQVEWGEWSRQYTSEPPQQNCALRIKQAALMQKALHKDVQFALEMLNETESLAREFYRKLDEHSQGMASSLQTQLAEKKLDRAIVYVGEYPCKSLLASLPPTTSYLVLIPISGTDRRKDPDFSHIRIAPEQPVEVESNIRFYKDIEESFKLAPRQLCENPLCRFSAPVIYDRVVCFTHPGSQAIFYCDTCNKYYCGLELKPVVMSSDDFERLLSFNPLEVVPTTGGKSPFSFQCRHCGEFVGKGQKTIIWNISE